MKCIIDQDREKKNIIFNAKNMAKSFFGSALSRWAKTQSECYSIKTNSIGLKVKHVEALVEEEKRKWSSLVAVTSTMTGKITDLLAADCSSRVMMFDAKDLVIKRIWKGYREVEIGLVENNSKLLIVFLLTKRKLLEVYGTAPSSDRLFAKVLDRSK